MITTIFCTCHDSFAVVACAKFCCGLIIRHWITARLLFCFDWNCASKIISEMGRCCRVFALCLSGTYGWYSHVLCRDVDLCKTNCINTEVSLPERNKHRLDAMHKWHASDKSIKYWNGKCRHFLKEILITSCTRCQNDDFWYNQWWKFPQNENISISQCCQNNLKLSDHLWVFAPPYSVLSDLWCILFVLETGSSALKTSTGFACFQVFLNGTQLEHIGPHVVQLSTAQLEKIPCRLPV